jgi:hypothetical protein
VEGKACHLPVSIGFFDDAHSIQAIERYLKNEISARHPNIKFVIYDTSNAKHPKGVEIIIQDQENESTPKV